jgi:hypothetical protein
MTTCCNSWLQAPDYLLNQLFPANKVIWSNFSVTQTLQL